MWATTLSVIAVAATVANFLFTQWRTDRREADKWRRDELLRLTSSLLELSGRRQSELIADMSALESSGRAAPADSDAWALTREMRIVALHIRLLDEDLAHTADAVWKLHYQAEASYNPQPNQWEDTNQLVVVDDSLEAAHSAVVRQFRASALPKKRLPKRRPIGRQ